jgi:serine/threonine protein kinase
MTNNISKTLKKNRTRKRYKQDNRRKLTRTRLKRRRKSKSKKITKRSSRSRRNKILQLKGGSKLIIQPAQFEESQYNPYKINGIIGDDIKILGDEDMGYNNILYTVKVSVSTKNPSFNTDIEYILRVFKLDKTSEKLEEENIGNTNHVLLLGDENVITQKPKLITEFDSIKQHNPTYNLLDYDNINLNNYYICKIYAHGLITFYDHKILREDIPYSIIQKLNGGDLCFYEKKSCLNIFSKINKEHQIDILVQIAIALTFIHKSGYIYYDLKAENIMLDEKYDFGGKEPPKISLVDFGMLTKETQELQTESKGSYKSMSPEVYFSPKSPIIHTKNVDIFSFGMLIFYFIIREKYNSIYKKVTIKQGREIRKIIRINYDIVKLMNEPGGPKLLYFIKDQSDINKKLIDIIKKCLNQTEPLITDMSEILKLLVALKSPPPPPPQPPQSPPPPQPPQSPQSPTVRVADL